MQFSTLAGLTNRNFAHPNPSSLQALNFHQQFAIAPYSKQIHAHPNIHKTFASTYLQTLINITSAHWPLDIKSMLLPWIIKHIFYLIWSALLQPKQGTTKPNPRPTKLHEIIDTIF